MHPPFDNLLLCIRATAPTTHMGCTRSVDAAQDQVTNACARDEKLGEWAGISEHLSRMRQRGDAAIFNKLMSEFEAIVREFAAR